jgi:hypothetical protein
MILKFTDFINEARKSKKEITDLLGELFSKKPAVKVSDKTQKGIYSLAGIIQYFKDNGMSSQNATDALYHFDKEFEKREKGELNKTADDKNDKELTKTIKNVSVDDSKLCKKYPYYYVDLTKEQADKIKSELEEDSKEKAAPELAKRAEMRKKSAALSKEKKEKKPTTTKTSTRKTTTKK